MTEKQENRSPVLFIPHGGGPLPLLGDEGHEKLVDFLQSIPARLGKPSAILVVSAHWEESRPTITAASSPPLIYDYRGFPEESYSIEYPAPGSPELAENIRECLAASGFEPELDMERGFDHGMFVPLKIMYPDAGIPCVQLSLLESLDPAEHIKLGKAISSLRKQNVLILGSGLSYHNMREFWNGTEPGRSDNVDFDFWLIDACTSGRYEMDEREQILESWENAPGARECHPREEHLLPLHVCLGAALGGERHGATTVFNDDVLGRRASAFLWK